VLEDTIEIRTRANPRGARETGVHNGQFMRPLGAANNDIRQAQDERIRSR
jgi:hypothetical protein